MTTSLSSVSRQVRSTSPRLPSSVSRQAQSAFIYVKSMNPNHHQAVLYCLVYLLHFIQTEVFNL